MSRAIEGIYRQGQIELAEVPEHVEDNTRVIVTFVEGNDIDLERQGIDQAAAKIRSQLLSFAEEWDSPEMDDYNDYDAVLLRRQAR